MTWMGGMVGEVGGGSRGRGVCIHTTDPLCCTAETHNIVNQLSSNLKKERERSDAEHPLYLQLSVHI